MSKRKVIPLGPPLDTPDDELDMLALVSAEDIEAAKADGRARMGAKGAALLEAAKTPPPEDAS
jgi:hypothetical protein